MPKEGCDAAPRRLFPKAQAPPRMRQKLCAADAVHPDPPQQKRRGEQRR